MNVHHASLFPDLIGASDYCNLLMEEAHRQQAIEEGAIEKEVSDTVKLGDEVTAEIIPAEVPEDLNEVERLTALLNGPEKSSQVEPGRIQLIAKQLSKEFEKHKVVDWESRDAIQAKLRNIARVILRKYSYPVALRDPVIEKILAALPEAQKDESEGEQEE